MTLKSLFLCSDEKIVRVLRRTLGDLEIGVEHCSTSEAALRKLSRERFEAIVVDCAAPGAADVLRSARNAPCNKRSVAVAIMEPAVGLRSAFETGAHFVLYKPVSGERARSSFRAARALMKRERRRNSRVSVQIPVEISYSAGTRLRATTTDLSEGGLALKITRRKQPNGPCQVSFTLPGTETVLQVSAEFAWEGSGSQAGLRFLHQSPETATQLRQWLLRNSPDAENDDPPVHCRLTDLSLRGCYLELASPFPVSTCVTLSMRAGSIDVRTVGVVRVMHPDQGMGVEFTEDTAEHRASVQRFLEMLTSNRTLAPEVLVEPEGLEPDETRTGRQAVVKETEDDPLLELFRNEAGFSPELFRKALRSQRNASAETAAIQP